MNTLRSRTLISCELNKFRRLVCMAARAFAEGHAARFLLVRE